MEYWERLQQLADRCAREGALCTAMVLATSSETVYKTTPKGRPGAWDLGIPTSTRSTYQVHLANIARNIAGPRAMCALRWRLMSDD